VLVRLTAGVSGLWLAWVLLCCAALCCAALCCALPIKSAPCDLQGRAQEQRMGGGPVAEKPAAALS
jgi:hypothetical protein